MTVGMADKKLVEFIYNIPDDKPTSFSAPQYTVYPDANFRLDVQKVTSGHPAHFNIQVQINSGTTISTLKKMAQKTGKHGTTVSKALVPVDNSWDVGAVKQAFLDGKML